MSLPTREVFAVRVWFVPILTFNAATNDMVALNWDPTVVAGLSVLVAVPPNLALAEAGVRWERRKVIFAVSLESFLVCGVLGWQAAGAYFLVLVLMLFYRVTSYGDVGAIAGGVVAASTGETRVAALVLIGIIGFTFGFLGPPGGRIGD